MSSPIQNKAVRLETLRRYQAYYGPNTPPAILAEIQELTAQLQAEAPQAVTTTRPTPAAKPKKSGKGKKRRKKKHPPPKNEHYDPNAPFWQLRKQSRRTQDLIATMAFIGFVLLLAAILMTAYLRTQVNDPNNTVAANVNQGPRVATLRPTFTPTALPGQDVAPALAADVPPIQADPNQSYLPAPQQATTLPTVVPTLTPSPPPRPTNTPIPPPTSTPTAPPPPPAAPPPAAPAAVQQAPPTDTPPPPPPPAPAFPFTVQEQGNRMFQGTNYHLVTVYIAVTDIANNPVGGYRIIGEHSPTGRRVESPPTTWDWSVANCLDCDYIKQGNVKFEPGPFEDGIWNLYVVDGGGSRVSETVPLSYSSDPSTWVWDFIIFRKTG